MSISEKLASGAYDNKNPWCAPSRDRAGHGAWLAEEARVVGLLRDDLEREYGVAGHEKAQALWDLAWSHGHASGLSQVVDHYGEFVRLLEGK